MNGDNTYCMHCTYTCTSTRHKIFLMLSRQFIFYLFKIFYKNRFTEINELKKKMNREMTRRTFLSSHRNVIWRILTVQKEFGICRDYWKIIFT